MAFKKTVNRTNIVDGDELGPEAAGIFEAYRADGRIMGTKTTALEPGKDILEMWFTSKDVHDAYAAEILAIDSFRVEGVIVEDVDFVDNVEFPGADAMDSVVE